MSEQFRNHLEFIAINKRQKIQSKLFDAQGIINAVETWLELQRYFKPQILELVKRRIPNA